jgi:hypothetical protein
MESHVSQSARNVGHPVLLDAGRVQRSFVVEVLLRRTSAPQDDRWRVGDSAVIRAVLQQSDLARIPNPA